MEEECRGTQPAPGEVQGDGPSSEGRRGQNHPMSKSQIIDKCPELPSFATANGPGSCQGDGGKCEEGRPSGAFGRVFLETPKTKYKEGQSRCFLHLSLLFLDTLWLFITLNQQNIDIGVRREQKK